MEAKEDIQERILEVFQRYDESNFDPIECLQSCKDILEDICQVDGEFDPRNIPDAQEVCNAYGRASNLFLSLRLFSAAISILIDGWNRFSFIQHTEKRRIYRAGLGMYLAKLYLQLGDEGAAFRWAILTYADDLLGGFTGGNGRQLLHSVLGMGEEALKELSSIADENISSIAENNDDWSIPFAYAEDVVTKFAFRKTAYSQLFAMRSRIVEFPVNSVYLSSLLERANDDNATATDKGRRLEDLASYLFLLIPSLTPRRNVLEETLAFETDIVVRNLNLQPDLISDLFGRHFLVECKNWKKERVNVQHVGYFLHRMRLTHAQFGIIFASNGITGGEEQEVAAHSIIRKTFHEDGNICIIINNDDLVSLIGETLTFRSLLIERVERLRFGKER